MPPPPGTASIVFHRSIELPRAEITPDSSRERTYQAPAPNSNKRIKSIPLPVPQAPRFTPDIHYPGYSTTLDHLSVLDSPVDEGSKQIVKKSKMSSESAVSLEPKDDQLESAPPSSLVLKGLPKPTFLPSREEVSSTTTGLSLRRKLVDRDTTPPRSFTLPLPEKPVIPVMPDTPFRPTRKTITSPFVIAAMGILESLTITRDNGTLPLLPEVGKRGQHSQIYRVREDSELISGIPNNRIYVKLFRKEVLLVRGNSAETKFLRTMLTQYDRLPGSPIPTIVIHNRATALADGYLILEKVTPIVLPWQSDTPIHTLSESDKALLKQIRTFFDFAFNDPSKDPIDLRPSNLSRRSDGSLVLFDFMEHREDEHYAFRMISRNCLEEFVNRNEEVHRYLCEGLLSTNSELYQMLNDTDPKPMHFDPVSLQRILSKETLPSSIKDPAPELR